jgi:hypothetical protein
MGGGQGRPPSAFDTFPDAPDRARPGDRAPREPVPLIAPSPAGRLSGLGPAATGSACKCNPGEPRGRKPFRGKPHGGDPERDAPRGESPQREPHRGLHADLRAKGVRCWFAPEDLKIGDRFQERIEEQKSPICRVRRTSAAHGCGASMTASSMRIGKRTVRFSRCSRSIAALTSLSTHRLWTDASESTMITASKTASPPPL